jgi:flagella basal body P-ring formation protein FlgA
MIGLLLLFAFTPAEALRDAVARQEAVPVADVEVGPLGTLSGAPADAEWSVRLPANEVCGRVPVVLTTGDHRYAVTAPITVWRELPVAATAVRSGAAITLTTARVPCTLLRGETPVDPSQSWEADVSIAAGAPVTMARVHTQPDVQKGANVRIEATAGALTVAAPGQLLQDGFSGQKVSVLNLATHAVLVGVYTGNNIVTLAAP